MDESDARNLVCDNVTQHNACMRNFSMNECLSVYHMNVQRVSRLEKFDKLKQHIDMFERKPDIMSFVETWFLQTETGELNDGNAIRLFEVEGYQSVFCSRTQRSAGIAIFIKNGLNFDVLRKCNGSVSYVQILLSHNEGLHDMALTFVYMPRFSNYVDLFECLEEILISRNFGRHLIVGDFNIDILKRTPTTLQYEMLLSSFGFEIKNNVITRPSGNNGSIIDHISANFSIDSCSTIRNALSDHDGIMSHMCVRSIVSPEPEFFESRFTDYERLNSQRIERLYDVNIESVSVHDRMTYLIV